MGLFHEIQQAIAHLDPKEVREAVERPVCIELYAAGRPAYETMEQFFHGDVASPGKVVELKHVLRRAGEPGSYSENAIPVFEEGVRAPRNAFVFHYADPQRVVTEILDEYGDDYSLALARHLLAFRRPVATRLVKRIAKENALFSLATALPDIIPMLSLPWVVGEFASDTAFLTMNQIRMAFLLAGACDRPVGYREQRGEIGSIVAGAFGWRALARELVGKIPLGGGLIPKAAVAYAGTYVMGRGIQEYHRFGRRLSRKEKREQFRKALGQGKKVANNLLEMKTGA